MDRTRFAQPVVCFGETMALLAPDPPAPLADTHWLQLSHGGAESNVAISLARLGHRAAWCSRLGADPLGDRIVADIAAAGVDISRVVRDSDRRTGLYLKDPRTDGTKVWYYRHNSAASAMDATDAERALAGRPALLHLSGITPALSQQCAQAVDYLLTAAAERSVRTSFDVNYRPALWPDRDIAARELLRCARRSHTVFVGRDEAAALWQIETAMEARQLLGEVDTLIVKDAAGVATSFSRAGLASVPAREVAVVEPVGAGDAFAAGWLHGLLLGMHDRQRLRMGHLMAELSLLSATDHGPLPDVPALEAIAYAEPEAPDAHH